MNKARMLIAVALCIAMILSVTAVADSQESDTLISFSSDINASVVGEIPAGVQSHSKMSNKRGTKDFTLTLIDENDGTYTGTGKILLENGLMSYVATGELSSYKLETGETAFIGTITGDVDNGRQTLFITIHSLPEQEKTFILVNASIRDESGNIVDNKVYAYGELFPEMNEFVPLYADDRESTVEEFIDETGNSVEPMVTTSDYNSKFVNTTITRYGNSTGGYYDLIALSVFAPNAMKPNGQYYMYAKVNSNNSNARSYAQTFLTVGVVTGLSVVNGTITMTAEKADIGFTSQSPETKTINVKIPVPVPSESGTGVTIKLFSVPILKINAELRQVGNYNTNNTNNCAYWFFDGNKNISWDSSVEPKDTEKAYAGQGYITNFLNLDYNTTCNMAFEGTLVYSYTSQYGVTQYSGTFGVSATYDHTVTLTKSTA